MKKKPETSKTVKKECDTLWAQCVKHRDRTCRKCNSDQDRSSHHIIEKTHLATRHDLDNGLCLCWRCHSNQKWNPQSFAASIIRIIGWPEFNRLYEKSRRITHRTINDWRLERERLKKELKRIKSDYEDEQLLRDTGI